MPDKSLERTRERIKCQAPTTPTTARAPLNSTVGHQGQAMYAFIPEQRMGWDVLKAGAWMGAVPFVPGAWIASQRFEGLG